MGRGPLEVRAEALECATLATDRAALLRAQIFKFSVYVTIPVLLTVAFAASPQNLQAIISNVRADWPPCATSRIGAVVAPLTQPRVSFPQRAYVVYPTEGPRPPSSDEIRELRGRKGGAR